MDAVQPKSLPPPLPELEGGARLLERRRATQLLDQQLIGVPDVHPRRV
jgi:hypothetical protein